MKWLFLALGSMFVQQTFVTLGKVLPSVLAPAIISELHIEASWLGVYVGMIAAVSLLVQAGCGSIIVRYGALRVSQISLLLTGVGLILAAPGIIALMVLSAIAIGASASSTPASSHLLSRYAPGKYAPLVFSAKQTAVPVALLIAGLIGPLLNEIYGWRHAFTDWHWLSTLHTPGKVKERENGKLVLHRRWFGCYGHDWPRYWSRHAVR